MLSNIILAQWRHSVASSEALDLLHWAIHAVTYQHIAMAIKITSIVGVFFHHHLFACHLGNRWGNTEQVVDQWWNPGASRVALDLLHRAMPCVLIQAAMHQHIAMAIKMASIVGVFFHHRLFACHPSSCWGDTEQVVDQWWHPGASSVALDLLHRAMPCVLLQPVRMAIEMASGGGALFSIINFCLNISKAKGPCYSPN